MRSRTGSRMRRASSGSRSASSSLLPFRSANRTVTCLRSPSRAPRVLAPDGAPSPGVAGPVALPSAVLARLVLRPPPAELQALLDAVGAGRPLYLFLRE